MTTSQLVVLASGRRLVKADSCWHVDRKACVETEFGVCADFEI